MIIAVSLLLILAAVTNVSDAGKILAVFPFPATSHMFVMNSIINGLADKGHEVTVITALPQKNVPGNLKQIDIDLVLTDMMKKEVNFFAMGDMNTALQTLFLFGFGSKICELVLSRPHIREFIKTSKEKYDVVILEAFFNECMLGFAHKFHAPIIQVCPIGGTEFIAGVMGNPHNYAYIPDFQLSYGTHMTFPQRIHNTIVGLSMKLARSIYYLPKQNSLMHKYFEDLVDTPLPYITDLEQNTSLVLLNNHVSLTYARPYLPNIVEVGGMHIKPPRKLPEDLQQFLDSAQDGVIYFSMGSNLKCSDLPDEKRDAFLQAFSVLKQRVLWKWEVGSLPGQPKNVKVAKWLPQSDLLAHPNVKLFITHGGLLSTQESVYRGKPLIGIPIFGDQRMNMQQAEASGYGYLLPFHDITTDTVSRALDAVLNTPKYRENAEIISRRFRDQIRPPLDTAVFWTEYVMRHQGARHMRSAALDLAWFQYYLLDVIAVIAAAALLLLAITFFLLRAVLRRCLRKKKVVEKKKKKKN